MRLRSLSTAEERERKAHSVQWFLGRAAATVEPGLEPWSHLMGQPELLFVCLNLLPFHSLMESW